ncbi:MAG TPA: YciI family protein [Opitutaceae bacterium]|nr:YciI family protein [Opitutaceae bacterium]
MDTTDTAPSAVPYLLIFRNTGPENYQHLSPEQRQQLVTHWNAWFEELLAQGKATEGQPLEMETRIVSGPRGARVVDGPFPEAKEAVGGYVKLMVGGLDEATEIARRHPGLAYGLVIEVRQLTPHCHLGVNTRPAVAREISTV